MSKTIRYKVDLNNLTPLTDEQKAEIKALHEMPDSEIDYSDIPPLDETFWKNAVRNPFYKPTKTSTMGTHAPTISKPIINVREPHLFPILKTKDQNIINNAIVEGQKKDVIIIKTHIRKLLTEMNITTGGKNFQNIRTRLKRLASITIWVDNEKEEAAYYLLNYKFDKESEMLHIELNNTITNTIIQNTNYTLIELDEIRQLKTAPARLVHQRLCGWINFGKNSTVGMDTLCDYIWTTPALTHNIKKHRKQVIKKTIEELKSIGWKIWEAEPGQYNIFRVHD
jgi:hypothetical protein